MASILERDATELNDTMARFACLALGLLLLEKQEKANPVLERLKEMKGEFGEYCQLTVQTCAYAGSGNVLKVQQMLSICSDHLEEKNSHQVLRLLLCYAPQPQP